MPTRKSAKPRTPKCPIKGHWYEWHPIKGHLYLYEHWRVEGRKQSQYVRPQHPAKKGAKRKTSK